MHELALFAVGGGEGGGGEGGGGDAHVFDLALTTSAGTYVKEFVHGDLGRTRPSVRDLLGCAADIVQLDVVDVIDGDGDDAGGGGGGGGNDADDADD